MLPKVSLSSPFCRVHTAADLRSVALRLRVRNPHQLCGVLANILPKLKHPSFCPGASRRARDLESTWCSYLSFIQWIATVVTLY